MFSSRLHLSPLLARMEAYRYQKREFLEVQIVQQELQRITKERQLIAEASNFVNSIAHVALSSAAGKHPMDEPPGEESAPHDAVPDPSAVALGAADARVAAKGENPKAVKDKTKIPMQAAMWTKMRPIMHALTDIADTWERFGNALSPTPPFPQEGPRLRLTSLVVPLLAMSIFVTSYMFVKSVTFGIGFGFFGDQLFRAASHGSTINSPTGKRFLNSETQFSKAYLPNAQLTITLLRIGEANKAPIPPPPISAEIPTDEAADVEDEIQATGGDLPLGATQSEIQAAASAKDATIPQATSGGDIDAAKEHKHGKKGSRILGFFKGAAKGTVETAIANRYGKSKSRLVGRKESTGCRTTACRNKPGGPVDFKGRFHGKKGHVYISTKATIPCVAFTTNHTVERVGSQDRDDLHPIWSIAIADIMRLKSWVVWLEGQVGGWMGA